MAMEGYVARLPSSVVLRPQMRSGQADIALAQGVTALGQTMGQVAEQNFETDERIAASNHQIAMEQKRRDQSAIQAIALGKKFDLELALRQEAAALRGKTTDEAATGHDTRVAEAADKRAGEFIDWLAQTSGNDPEVMERFTPMIRAVRDDVLGDEAQWQLGERTKAEGNGYAKAVTAMKNAQLAKPDLERGIADLSRMRQVFFANETMPFSLKTKLWDSFTYDVLGAGALDGMIMQGNIGQAQKVLNSGVLDSVLGDTKEQWLKRVDAGAREQALAIERGASEARTAAMDGLKSIKVDIDNDGEVPQDTINAAFAAAKAAGVKEADLKEFAYLAEGAAQRTAMRGMTTPQLENAAGALRQKVNAGQASAEDARRLDRAEKALDQRDSKDGESLSGLWQQGPQGQMAAMVQLAQLPVDRARAVAGKMDKPELSVLAGLRPQVQRVALLGLQVAADRKADYLPQNTPGGASGNRYLETAFKKILGPVETELTGEVGAMRDAAMAIYIGNLSNKGVAKGWDEAAFEKATKIAFGASARPDGSWQGGLGTVRGRKVQLPDHLNESEFDRYVSRFDYAGTGAVYGDGRKANQADIAAHYRPAVNHIDPDGTVFYRMMGPQGALYDAKAKRVFLLPVRPR